MKLSNKALLSGFPPPFFVFFRWFYRSLIFSRVLVPRGYVLQRQRLDNATTNYPKSPSDTGAARPHGARFIANARPRPCRLFQHVFFWLRGYVIIRPDAKQPLHKNPEYGGNAPPP